MKIGYNVKRFFHNSARLINYNIDLVKIMAEFYLKKDTTATAVSLKNINLILISCEIPYK